MPIGLIERLNEFLKSDYAKKNGFTSKADVLIFILREFLDSYEQSVQDVTTSALMRQLDWVPPSRLNRINFLE